MPRTQVKEKVAEVAKILGIEDILNRPVGGLSGVTVSALPSAAPSCAIPKPS